MPEGSVWDVGQTDERATLRGSCQGKDNPPVNIYNAVYSARRKSAQAISQSFYRCFYFHLSHCLVNPHG